MKFDWNRDQLATIIMMIFVFILMATLVAIIEDITTALIVVGGIVLLGSTVLGISVLSDWIAGKLSKEE